MNVVDCFVKKILRPPYKHGDCWCVDVEFISWGTVSKGTIYGLTLEEAQRVEVGYKFQQ